ncbi:cytochrome C oxidase subunit II [Arsenicicoccus sp. oral taxon 190]|nr:cytochrome c oxidase subunit II [Arsenicicoccus sp. oral taxon 190]AKT52064.1 cytochrome C oxidase subunit II [Arsenicicoccus sp. oral taxon 190]
MRRHDDSPRATQRVRALVGAASLVALTTVLSGCSEAAGRGFLPRGATTSTARIESLWVWTWIVALAVGCVVWGLTVFCMVRFRRRPSDTGYPAQLRYNVPVEIFYTVVPILMVGVLFYYTARDEAALLDTSKKPDVTVNAVGKQWSWDFNYVEANTYVAGEQAHLNGKPGAEAGLPTLVLPVHKRVEFVLTSRDVIHSFWVPAFQQKLDMIPGRVNKFQVVTDREGDYKGKCAELCGAYHSQMLFNVKVVSQEDYDKYISALKAQGNSGQLPNGLSREKVEPTEQAKIPTTQGSSN